MSAGILHVCLSWYFLNECQITGNLFIDFIEGPVLLFSDYKLSNSMCNRGLAGCLRFNGSLRQYLSLYRAQRLPVTGRKKIRYRERKNVQNHQPGLLKAQ